jgi:hypothetical protein
MVDLLCWIDAYLIVTTDVEALASAFFPTWRIRSSWAFSIFLCSGSVFRGGFAPLAPLAAMVTDLNLLIQAGFPKATRVGVEGGQGSRSDREAAWP